MVLTSVTYSKTQNYTGKNFCNIFFSHYLVLIPARSQETLENQKLQNVEFLNIAYNNSEKTSLSTSNL
jgi:hypothetical protein